MKRTYTFILLLALTATTVYAQDKLFKDALSQTRPTGCWYKWENTKDKQIKMEKVQAYARKNNLLLGKTTTKEVGRFGDIAVSAHTVEFIPPEEIPAYIIENLLDNTISAYYFQKKGAALVPDNPSKRQYFKWVNDALWSGNVVDGRIDGKGKGGKQIDAMHYIAFDGTFKNGIPQGEVKFYTYQAGSQYEYYNSRNRGDKSEKFGTMKEGMTWFDKYYHGFISYGFVDENGHVVVQPIFNTVTDYSNGTATVTINKVQFDVDKQGTFTGLHSGQTVSVQQLVDLKKYSSEFLTATQSAAKQMIPKSNVDDLIKMASEFTALRGDVETELKKDIPSYTLADLAKVDNAFSNLKDLTLKRRTAIYNADCAKLATAYSNAVASSKQHQENTKDRDFVSQFVSNYENNYTFDPDNKVTVAKQIQDYYEMCDAVMFKPSSSYTCLSCDPPQYYGAGGTFDWLNAAMNKTSNPPADFKEYADYAYPLIKANYNNLCSIIDREISAYHRAFETAKNAAYRTLNAIKSYSDVTPYLKDINEGKVEEHHEYDGDIFHKGRGELVSTNQRKEYKFENGINVSATVECRDYRFSNVKCNYSSWWNINYNRTHSGSINADSWEECVVYAYKKAKEHYLDNKYKESYPARPTPWQ
ncbi:MAG: WG repeat-containing protein [Bacteroidales bacterium]|nr:WG repeat-containing protein [Bacteroidales bacterium]